MKKKVLVIASVLVLIALVVWAFAPRPIEVQTAQAVQGVFERTVEEDGKTRVRDRYVVSAPLGGRLDRLYLQEGDAVVRGALLAQLSPTAPAMLDARTQSELQARVRAIEANQLRAKIGIDRAAAALVQARDALARSEALSKQGFVSPTQSETERLNVVLRDKELASAKQEAHVLEHDLEQAKAAVQQYTRTAGAAIGTPWEIRSPVTGQVLKLVQKSEAVLAPGTPILEVGDPHNLEIVADILTTDAAQVTPGMPVQITAGENTTFLEGRVWRIEPAAFTKVSALGVEEQRVNVLIDITSPPDNWRFLGDAYRVNARIVVQRVNSALKISVSAVFPDADGYAVFVIDGGRARKVKVEIGARNQTEALIKSGLDNAAQVILYPPSKLKEGDRVVARKADASNRPLV
jgi:HlyD family secretion protein